MVALGIFLVHMASMIFLILVGGVYMMQNTEIFANNLREPLKYDWPLAILFGFCTAMLGVTGFETSANYIEEQQKGVFPKTLFNSWIIVFVMNPILSIVCLGVLDLGTLESHHRDVLAKTGDPPTDPTRSSPPHLGFPFTTLRQNHNDAHCMFYRCILDAFGKSLYSAKL